MRSIRDGWQRHNANSDSYLLCLVVGKLARVCKHGKHGKRRLCQIISRTLRASHLLLTCLPTNLATAMHMHVGCRVTRSLALALR